MFVTLNLYKTNTNGSECWLLSTKDRNMLWILERGILTLWRPVTQICVFFAFLHYNYETRNYANSCFNMRLVFMHLITQYMEHLKNGPPGRIFKKTWLYFELMICVKYRGKKILVVKVLGLIYYLTNDNGIQRTVWSNDLYTVGDEIVIVKMIKIGRFRWLGHFFRVQELDPCRKLTFLKTEGTRCARKPHWGGLGQL
jgi:hypothetical protein